MNVSPSLIASSRSGPSSRPPSPTDRFDGTGPAIPPAGSVSLDLPTPPSVNECYRNVKGRGRVKSSKYVDWLGHAGWSLQYQKPGRVPGYVVVMIAVERTSDAADIDNRVKATLDLLTKHEVIDDDRFVVGLLPVWSPPASKLCRVLVLPAADYDFQFRLSPDGKTGGFFLSPEGACGRSDDTALPSEMTET